MTAADIANSLGKASRIAGGYMACCPAHDDKNPSLSVKDSDNGKVLVKCFAGCSQEDVIAALKTRGLWESEPPQLKLHQRVTGKYEYYDHDGNLYYWKERLEPGRDGRRKDFLFWHYDKDGKRQKGRGYDPILYREAEVFTAKAVIFVEGEKQADLLSLWGVTATTLDSGAKSPWRHEYESWLSGKRIAILPDNDIPGSKYATMVAKQLHSKVESLKVVDLPQLPEKGDICDWITIPGNDKSKLLEIIKATPEWEPIDPSPEDENLSETEIESQEWPETLPLIRPLQDNDPFPVEILPPVMRDAVISVQEVIQSPLDMICQSFLAAATLAVQPYADVLIDGRCFPVSNNFVAVGESGERKSATDNIATGPIKERQRKESEAFHQGKQAHEAAFTAWQNGRKEAFKESDKGVIEAMLNRLGDEPKHVQPFYIFEEPSFEGIERAYAEERYTLGLYSDEGGRFLGGYAMNKENQTRTVTGLSKLWDGKPLDRVRGGDGLSVLYGRRFSMHLMIQPVLCGQLFGNAMLTGQGFLSRCLCSYPKSTIGSRPYKSHDLSVDPAIISYNAAINSILNKPLPLDQRAEMGLKPTQLTLTDDAKSIFISFADHVEGLQREGEDLFPIKGFASKAAEHAARIAGVLTIFKTPNAQEISAEAINGGIAIAQYYIGEALRLFHSASDDKELLLAQKVFDWGVRQQDSRIALADLYRLGPNGVRDKKTATRMLRILEEHHRAFPVPGGAEVNGQKRREVWQLRG